VRGLKTFFEPKTGKVYRYHRKTGIRIKSAPGTAAFFAELSAAEAKLNKSKSPKAVHGTLESVIVEYRQSPGYQILKPRTKRDYERVLDYLAPLGKKAVTELDPPKVARIRDMAFQKRRFRFANYTLAVLSVLMEFAKERGLIVGNPGQSRAKNQTAHRFEAGQQGMVERRTRCCREECSTAPCFAFRDWTLDRNARGRCASPSTISL
jgi:hypothetical protein